MIKEQFKGSILLVITAIIWGSAFVAQSTAMDAIGPYTFYASRSLLATLVLLPVIFFIDRTKANDSRHKTIIKDKKTHFIGGAVCGVLLCTASLLQQFGLVTTEPGKAGFLTSMYLLIVPVISLFLGKKVLPRVLFCIPVAVVGMYFLCVKDTFSISMGDTYVIICAFIFSFHILAVDKFSPMTDGVRLSCIQFAVCTVISTILAFVFETPDIKCIKDAGVSIIYTGVFSSGVAYTLQIIAQKYTHPTTSSMIMSMESVFALLTQIAIIHIIPTPKEVFGCVLMFFAVIISQLPSRIKGNM